MTTPCNLTTFDSVKTTFVYITLFFSILIVITFANNMVTKTLRLCKRAVFQLFSSLKTENQKQMAECQSLLESQLMARCAISQLV